MEGVSGPTGECLPTGGGAAAAAAADDSDLEDGDYEEGDEDLEGPELDTDDRMDDGKEKGRAFTAEERARVLEALAGQG